MKWFVRGTAVALAAMAAWASPAAALMGWESSRKVSADGDAVALRTADQLVPADTDESTDLYVWKAGTYVLVADGFAWPSYVSDHGSRVLFTTGDALVPEDTDDQADVYVNDAGTIRLVSTGPTDPGSGVPGIGVAGHANDARTVFFHTKGRMVAQDTDDDYDVYRWEDGTTTLVSTDGTGANATGAVYFAAASADGARVVLWASASLLPEDVDDRDDAYVREGGTLRLVTKGTTAGVPDDAFVWDVNTDATSIVWTTGESLDPRDADVYEDVYQRLGSTTRLVSANDLGVSVPCSAALDDPPGGAYCGSVAAGQSDDGAHVFFTSIEPMVRADRNQTNDLYDRVGSTTDWVSVGPPTTGGTAPDLVLYRSGHVLFESQADLAPGGANGGVFDRFGGTTRFVSEGKLRAASPDARRVIVETYSALTPADTDRSWDLYELHDGTAQLLTTGPAGGNGDHSSPLIGHSDDVSVVYFLTSEQLTADDTDTMEDIYRRAGGVTTLIGGTP
jgi:hypothetical protein